METKHPALKDKPLKFSKEKKCKHKGSNYWRPLLHQMRALFLVAKYITKAKKFLIIDKKLFRPAAKDICCEIQATVQMCSSFSSTITK